MANISVVEVRSALVSQGVAEEDITFPTKPADVPIYNLRLPIIPFVIVKPRSAQGVASAVKVAKQFSLKVQARGGGHSFANYGFGGVDGHMVVHLEHFTGFSIDPVSWRATIGPANRLEDVARKLHDNGGRALPHGVCPKVGISGHATTGGLSPLSRQYGFAVDAIRQVEAVTAEGEIVRANSRHNADLFWAIRGAASSFAIVTEFVFETYPTPTSFIEYRFQFDPKDMAKVFKRWQTFFAKPDADVRLASFAYLTGFAGLITGEFTGTKEEFEATGLEAAFEGHTMVKRRVESNSYINHVLNWDQIAIGNVFGMTDEEAALMSGADPSPFYCKSQIVKKHKPLSDEAIDKYFNYAVNQDAGTPIWFIMIELVGGFSNKIPLESAAFAHRESFYVVQTISVDIAPEPFKGDFDKLPITVFQMELDHIVRSSQPDEILGAYTGYMDPKLDKTLYYGSNYPRLVELKEKLDPGNIFANPQSVGSGLAK